MKPFVENTLACTIGTIIGIVLTIGTTFLATKIDTRRSEKQQIQMLVQGLKQNINAFEEQAEALEHLDSLNTIIYQNWDDLSVLEDSTLEEWKSYLLLYKFDAIDMTAARIFSSNIETWRNISSVEFINFIGTSSSVIEKLVELNHRREDAWFNLFHEVCVLKERERINDLSNASKCQLLIQQPAANEYMDQVALCAPIFRASTKALRECLDRYEQMFGLPVTDDEPQLIYETTTTIQPDTLTNNTPQ